MSTELGKRIKQVRKSLRMTQAELAQKAKVSMAAISKIETGSIKNPVVLPHIADALKTTINFLRYGKNPDSVIGLSGENILTEVYTAPIISWERAISWNEKGDNHYASDLLNVVILFGNESKHSYALIIKNDVMTSFFNSKVSFFIDDIIICDPSRKHPLNNEFVIAHVENDKEVICMQYLALGGKPFLRPLNHQFPAIPFDKNKMKICATVIRKITEF
jgi:transcriptional regulator with XRE-family HTH domain